METNVNDIDQPQGFLLFNYIMNYLNINTEGWNVVTLTVDDSVRFSSLSYSGGKLYIGGAQNYSIDLNTGMRTPWLNGLTVNGISPSSGGVLALTRAFLYVDETTQKRFCPHPSDLVLPNFGYNQKGEKILDLGTGDLYVGFKNSIQEFSQNNGTPTYDCSIYKFTIGNNISQDSCNSTTGVPMNLFAGTPGSCTIRDGGLTSSFFKDIIDLLYDKERNAIYVCEGQAIRKIDLMGNRVSTLVGGNTKFDRIVDGDLSVARVSSIGGCYFKNNNIYFTDKYSVRRFDLRTNRISSLADGKARSSSPKDGKGGGASIFQGGAITGDEEGNLYFIDKENVFQNCGSIYLIRKISPPDKQVIKNSITFNGVAKSDRNECFSPSLLSLYQDGQIINNGSTFEFPITPIGTSVTKTFEIRNQGLVFETLAETPRVNGFFPPEFSIGKISPYTIPAGGSATFTITFTPTNPFDTYLNLNCNEYYQEFGNIFFNVKGTGQ